MLAGLVAVWLLPACTPAITAVSAIGYDTQGRLIGAAKVCGGDIVQATLIGPAGEDVGKWHRSAPQKGVESWRLQDAGNGAWKPVGPTLKNLAAGTEYQFWVSNENLGERSNILDFYGSDLATLRPGQVLVARDGPTNAQGQPTWQVAAIALDQLHRENC